MVGMGRNFHVHLHMWSILGRRLTTPLHPLSDGAFPAGYP